MHPSIQIYMHIYIYIYIHKHTLTDTHKYICIYIYTHLCTNTHTHTHTHIYIYINIYINGKTYTCIHYGGFHGVLVTIVGSEQGNTTSNLGQGFFTFHIVLITLGKV